MRSQFLEATPHGELQEVFPDVFFVTGSVSLQSMQVSRNMTIVREGTELSLINTVRLNGEGLRALDALGTVKHVFKVGAFHGIDDPFYIDRYAPTVWGLAGMELPEGFAIDEKMDPNTQLPIADASLFTFETTSTPEAILRLEREGGILVSCDSLQNWTAPDQFFDEVARVKMAEWGFIKPANVGPGWLKAANPQAADFARLKQMSFRHLLSGHGEPLKETAHEQFSQTFRELFDV